MVAAGDGWGARAAIPETTVSKWGTKHVCGACGAKFYDLNKPKPICPKCGGSPASARSVAAKVAAKAREIVVVPEPEVDFDSEDGELVDLSDEFGGVEGDEGEY